MAEYIDKQAFNDAIREAVRKYPNTFYNGLEVARQIAHDIDAADVAPVRHGRWVMNDQSTPVCSRCGNVVAFISHPDKKWDFGNYCPNCGARMEEQDGI